MGVEPSMLLEIDIVSDTVSGSAMISSVRIPVMRLPGLQVARSSSTVMVPLSIYTFDRLANPILSFKWNATPYELHTA